MFRRIQTSAVIIVTRVKMSPALVPKALEPPMPPKAPASPPPLPRWIRTRQIRNSEVRTSSEFRMPVRMRHGRMSLSIEESNSSCHDRFGHVAACRPRRPGRSASVRRADSCRRQALPWAVTSCAALMMAEEVARLEAGAADQGAVDVGAGEQLGGVVGLDAPPILDDDPGGGRLRRTSRPSQLRMNAWTSWACSGVAVRPVPIAQTGS